MEVWINRINFQNLVKELRVCCCNYQYNPVLESSIILLEFYYINGYLTIIQLEYLVVIAWNL